MAHRTFRDERGELWHVWSVIPTKVERREKQLPIPVADERRHVSEYRVALGNGMSNGWLCFESRDEKRRLTPVPEGWAGKTDAELAALLPGSRVVPRRAASVPVSARRDSSPGARPAREEED
jgi:hypothetical protein